VQRPHPPLYMSGSSPEAGEFAARNRIGIGFAFTTVPLAKSAAQHYRACARDAGWEPAADNVIYRAMFHVADTDEQAFADMRALPPRVGLVDQNKAIGEASGNRTITAQMPRRSGSAPRAASSPTASRWAK
jgi:alkanesulfonate monooxygenase SsuD/methylene tetrahydromethanopterin reductase-like flavin-dependent oxidoreductase (luciferase family)